MTDELVNKEFSRVLKGYDVDEVEEYIETVIGLYDQLENENKELSMRCEQLTASLEEAKSKASEADAVIAEAREKAQKIVDSAESSARLLLTEVKAKRDELLRATQEKHDAAAAAADEAKARAEAECREQTERTERECAERRAECDAECERKLAECNSECGRKLSECDAECERKLAECDSEIEAKLSARSEEISELERKKAEKEAEYNETASIAREFRESLFAHYSEQILRLENFEIPAAAEPELIAEPEPAAEPEPIAEPEPAAEPEPIAEPEPAAEPEPVAEPEPAIELPAIESAPEEDMFSTQELAAVFDLPPKNTAEDSLPFTAPKQKRSFDDTMTMFSVEKEQSGQVHYDINEISSVKSKLEDIISKKGDTNDRSEQNVSRKLGFLK